ncbi:tetratricopeptide repeat protein [Lipingzhangella sp. LS1_29]|uniref:Tetratricopeptide repeat protein n=1 Tax=Lipingzhangella rawalii TaxID=2055835 RepID=A0ABU2H1M8_9ACTN|nr:tetratricopeptide repeat protein [Lipingzhangella rawalii]MDS1268907.1 tetratricopeptide repeat protein [Lipingzhangella rawalii]
MTEPDTARHTDESLAAARVLWEHAEPDHERESEPSPEAIELAAQLGAEPLALRLMGRLLREHPLTIGGYANARSLLDHHDPDTRADAATHNNSALHRVCVVSMTHLDQQRLTRARPLLAVVAFLGAAGVPVPLRRLDPASLRGTILDTHDDVPGSDEVELGLGVLAAHGFVSRRLVDGEATITLHPVVTRVIRELLGASALEVAESVSVILARGKGADGDFDMEDAAYRAVLAVRDQRLGSEHPDTLWTQHRLADLAARRGDLDAAETAYQEVLRAQTQALGAEHPDSLWSRYRLAWVTQRRGDPAAAEASYRELLGVQRRVLGDRHPYTRLTQEALAEITRGASAR